jgi:hypothetical protein
MYTQTVLTRAADHVHTDCTDTTIAFQAYAELLAKPHPGAVTLFEENALT